MVKAVELKRQTTELPVYVSDATQNLTKGQKCLKAKGWNFGKKRTEKRLPCYLNQGTYIPKFQEMTFETIELLQTLHDYSQSSFTP
jgi:hypothetical protein